MQTTEDPPRSSMRTRETYTPGYSTQATGFMSARTLESHASFVLPLLDRGLEVLDVGCGPGTITQGIAEHVMPGRVTAIDRDPSQVAHASLLAQGRELMNLRFAAANVYELPFSEASFDLVFSHGLFEHLSNPAAALAQIRRVLRPGGLVALSSPDWNAFQMKMATPEAEGAIQDYRDLLESNGGNTEAGGELVRLLQEGEFGLIRKGQRFENHESPLRIATYLALQLDAAGNPGAARALIDWSTEPGAELIGCWKHVIGIKWNR